MRCSLFESSLLFHTHNAGQYEEDLVKSRRQKDRRTSVILTVNSSAIMEGRVVFLFMWGFLIVEIGASPHFWNHMMCVDMVSTCTGDGQRFTTNRFDKTRHKDFAMVASLCDTVHLEEIMNQYSFE